MTHRYETGPWSGAAAADALYAQHTSAGWRVVDPAGGAWWPNEQAKMQIECSADPAQTALEIARREPMLGEWLS